MKTLLLESDRYPWALERLEAEGLPHAWGIQDLQRWPDRSRMFVAEDSSPLGFSYLLVSGHPASRGSSTVILGGSSASVAGLLEAHLPEPPVTIRETPASLLPTIRAHLPAASVYLQQRMEVSRSTFAPCAAEGCRRLTVDDAPALAKFRDLPPRAAEGQRHWIRGAFVMGAFEGDELLATASTMVQTSGAWVLVAVETRSERRGEGFGSKVTSALTAAGLAEVPAVSLTVRQDNPAAIRVYEKLGFARREDRIWVDHGAGSAP